MKQINGVTYILVNGCWITMEAYRESYGRD